MKKTLWVLFALISSGIFAQKTVLNLEDNEDYSGFELLKDSLENYTVFINGENHQYTKSNAALQLKTIKYLHKNAGVRTLLLELGWSRGYIITQYIQTGDTTLLPAINNYSWQYYAEMVAELKKYNDSLPQDQKIQVVGIDVERFNNMAIKALQLQMPKRGDKIPHDSIAVSIESLEALDYYLETSSKWDEEKGEYVNEGKSGPSANRTIEEILQNIQKHKGKYLQYIDPKNHAVFLKATQQLLDKDIYDTYDDRNTVQAYVYREQYMYKEFLQLFEKDTTQKFFMQFGRCHSVKVYQEEACGWYNYYSIANRINESKHQNLNGKVLSTAIYYPNSDSWTGFDSELKEHIETVYLDSSAQDSLTFWNVSTDSILKNKHEFIIVNLKPLDADKDPKEEDSWDSDDAFDDDKAHFIINISSGYSTLSYKELNNFLNTKNYPSYARTGYWGLNLGSLKNKSLYLDVGINTVFSRKKISSTADTMQINPIYLHLNLGLDLLKNKKTDLIPFVGLGTETLSLREKKQTSTGIFTGLSESKANSTTYNIKTGLKFQFNLNPLLLGIEASYLTNVGKTKWKENAQSIKTGPNLKTQGMLLGGYLGLVF